MVLGARRVYERVKIDLCNGHERYIGPFSLYYCAMVYASILRDPKWIARPQIYVRQIFLSHKLTREKYVGRLSSEMQL